MRKLKGDRFFLHFPIILTIILTSSLTPQYKCFQRVTILEALKACYVISSRSIYRLDQRLTLKIDSNIVICFTNHLPEFSID